jgi:hypothetical protein
VIECLEQVALIEPTSDASTKAIDRARQALLQEQPHPVRRRSIRVAVVAGSCVVALVVLLVPVVNHFWHGPRPPAAHGPMASDPTARSNIQALPGAVPENNEPPGSGPVARSNLPAPSDPSGPAEPSGPAGPAVSGDKPPVPGKPSPPAAVGAKPGSRKVEEKRRQELPHQTPSTFGER